MKGSRAQITHSVFNGFSSTYSSFEKFSKADSSIIERTSSFDYELDFLIVLPAETPQVDSIAQRYKLNIMFTCPEDSERDIFEPYFLRDLRGRSILQTRLEYSDFAVAQAIDATVQSWVNCIEAQKIGSAVRFLMKAEESIVEYTPDLFALIAPACGILFLLRSDVTPIIGCIVILMSFTLSSLTNRIITSFVRGFYRSIRRYSPQAVVLLTEGDKRYAGKVGNNIKKMKAAMTLFSAGIVLSFAVNLASSWVYDHIFK